MRSGKLLLVLEARLLQRPPKACNISAKSFQGFGWLQ